MEKLPETHGYNALTGEYVDMIKAGILDPTKVARCALENAASIAGMLLTTEAIVAEIPDEKAARSNASRHGLLIVFSMFYITPQLSKSWGVFIYRKSFMNTIHPDLVAALKLAYEPSGLKCEKLVKEPESEEYGAYEFELNGKCVKFRVAKITPTKVGQFVTLWKRIGNGPIQPHDLADPVDFFIVVSHGEHFGQFVFPKVVLFEKGIVSIEGKGGKARDASLSSMGQNRKCTSQKNTEVAARLLFRYCQFLKISIDSFDMQIHELIGRK